MLNGWHIRRATPELRRAGNRDLYLTHIVSGARAAIYPRGGTLAKRLPPFVAALPGGRAKEFTTRREAFAFIQRRAVAAYLEGN